MKPPARPFPQRRRSFTGAHVGPTLPARVTESHAIGSAADIPKPPAAGGVECGMQANGSWGVLAVTLIAASAGAAAPAAAECAMPNPAMSPAPGTVSIAPTIYRFELAYGEAAPLRVDGPDGPVSFTTRDLSATDGIRVTAIHVEASRGPITIHAGAGESEETYRYELGHPPAPAAPAVESVTWVQDAWTCSHSRGLSIAMRGAGVAAFRARWSDGVEAIVPAHDRMFWTRMTDAIGGEIDPAEANAFLGHPNCLADLVPTSHVDRRDLSLFAIYPDGTELEVELPRGPAADAATPPEVPPPPVPEAAANIPPAASACDDRGGRAWPFVAGFLLVPLAFLVGVLVIAHRRRRGSAVVP
jgi:hypothetical protein